jgi:hypothetical protein
MASFYIRKVVVRSKKRFCLAIFIPSLISNSNSDSNSDRSEERDLVGAMGCRMAPDDAVCGGFR